MPYTMDLTRLPLQAYKELLKTQNLLPGRRILWESIDEYFDCMSWEGIADVAQLKKRLNTPEKIAAFAAATGIPAEYLTILKREAGSLEQKPVPISDFPGVEPSFVSALREKGVQTSKDFYESGLCEPSAADMLQKVTAVNEEKRYYKAKLGEKDMQFCIDFARVLRKYGG